MAWFRMWDACTDDRGHDANPPWQPAVAMNECRSCGERGAALLLTMFLVAVMGILLAVAGQVWRTDMQREREAQLLFVGTEYARALSRYAAATPPGLPTLPERLEQLLLDQRQPTPMRHLRRLYRDPITDGPDWGLVKSGDRIVGVYSLATGVPFKQAGFGDANAGFAGARSYAGWRFVASAETGPRR